MRKTWLGLTVVLFLAFVMAFSASAIVSSIYREYQGCIDRGMDEQWCIDVAFYEVVSLEGER